MDEGIASESFRNGYTSIISLDTYTKFRVSVSTHNTLPALTSHLEALRLTNLRLTRGTEPKYCRFYDGLSGPSVLSDNSKRAITNQLTPTNPIKPRRTSN